MCRICAEKLFILDHTQCVLSQSAAHGNNRQDPRLTALNDDVGRLGVLPPQAYLCHIDLRIWLVIKKT